MIMRKKEYSGKPILSDGTCCLLQWGMVPIFICLAAIFCSVAAEPVLTVARARLYGGMLEVLLASLVLLSVGAFVAELSCREK